MSGLIHSIAATSSLASLGGIPATEVEEEKVEGKRKRPPLDQVRGQSKQPSARITGGGHLLHPNRCKDVSGHPQEQGGGGCGEMSCRASWVAGL